MGFREGCRDAYITTKVSLTLLTFGLVSNWLAFTTNSWLVYDNGNIRFYAGLWRVATQNGVGSVLDGSASLRMGVVQAFACVGFMCMNIGFILQLLFMFSTTYKQNSETGYASTILLILSSLTWLVSVIVFGASVEEGEFLIAGFPGNSEHFYYSYGLAVVTCGLAFFAGIFMCVSSPAVKQNLET